MLGFKELSLSSCKTVIFLFQHLVDLQKEKEESYAIQKEIESEEDPKRANPVITGGIMFTLGREISWITSRSR